MRVSRVKTYCAKDLELGTTLRTFNDTPRGEEIWRNLGDFCFSATRNVPLRGISIIPGQAVTVSARGTMIHEALRRRLQSQQITSSVRRRLHRYWAWKVTKQILSLLINKKKIFPSENDYSCWGIHFRPRFDKAAERSISPERSQESLWKW